MGSAYFDFWEREWPVIREAPHLVFGGGIAITVLTVSITWVLVNWGYRQRLTLADEREAFAEKVSDIARQFKDFKEAIAAGAGIDALTSRIERLEAAVFSALSGTLDTTEGLDIANFRGKAKRPWSDLLSSGWSTICSLVAGKARER
jgi:hypothetical protein